MINSKDTETIKTLVKSALIEIVLKKGGSIKDDDIIQETVGEAFDNVIKEMKQGGI